MLLDRNAEGKFPCPFCTKQYAKPSGLKQHIRRRNDSAPTHIQLHSDFSADTDDRPYVRSKCGTSAFGCLKAACSEVSLALCCRTSSVGI